MVTDVLWPPSFGENSKDAKFYCTFIFTKKKKKISDLYKAWRIRWFKPYVQGFPQVLRTLKWKGGGGTSVYTWGKHGELKTVFLKSR